MQERARAFAAKMVYNFLIQLLASLVFVVHFSNAFWHGIEAFPKHSSYNRIVPLLVIFFLHIVNVGV